VPTPPSEIIDLDPPKPEDLQGGAKLITVNQHQETTEAGEMGDLSLINHEESVKDDATSTQAIGETPSLTAVPNSYKGWGWVHPRYGKDRKLFILADVSRRFFALVGLIRYPEAPFGVIPEKAVSGIPPPMPNQKGEYCDYLTKGRLEMEDQKLWQEDVVASGTGRDQQYHWRVALCRVNPCKLELPSKTLHCWVWIYMVLQRVHEKKAPIWRAIAWSCNTASCSRCPNFTPEGKERDKSHKWFGVGGPENTAIKDNTQTNYFDELQGWKRTNTMRTHLLGHVASFTRH